MEHEVAREATGWIVSPGLAKIVVAAWAAIVLAYGFWRSRARGGQDPIRPSGPTGA